MPENGTGPSKHLSSIIPATIVAIVFIVAAFGSFAMYGTPWESKEKADANERVFQAEMNASNDKLRDVAELNKEAAAKLVEVETTQAVESEKQAEEERRIDALENSRHR